MTDILAFALDDEHLRLAHLQTLASVCTLWRDVIHCTPTLWSEVSAAHPFRLLQKAVVTSANTPLHLTYNAGEASIALSAFLDLMIPHRERWTAVSFRVSEYQERLELLGALFRHPPSCLQVLHLITNSPTTLQNVDLPGELLNNLRHLKLNQVRPLLPPRGMAELRLLDLINYFPNLSAYDVYFILANSPRLERVKVWGTHMSTPSIIPALTITHLHTLRLHDASVPALSALVGALRLPSCVDLQVDVTEEDAQPSMTFESIFNHLTRRLTLPSFVRGVVRVDLMDCTFMCTCKFNSETYLIELGMPPDATPQWVNLASNILLPALPSPSVHLELGRAPGAWEPALQSLTSLSPVTHICVVQHLTHHDVFQDLTRLLYAPVNAHGGSKCMFADLEEICLGWTFRSTDLINLVQGRYGQGRGAEVSNSLPPKQLRSLTIFHTPLPDIESEITEVVGPGILEWGASGGMPDHFGRSDAGDE